MSKKLKKTEFSKMRSVMTKLNNELNEKKNMDKKIKNEATNKSK